MPSAIINTGCSYICYKHEVSRMKKYKIELDETISEFFEEIALILKKPIEEVLSDALFLDAEKAKRKIAESYIIEKNEILYEIRFPK